ncbi:hypothetical protein AWC24_17355 [Mycolicibacter senuensis]|uniref:Uncharacterized protein n=1 Tax=Mycolicibacter senuensis TaxID=386913 RepID=A0A7I9XHI0_9MYCO|nr:hypothetical protein AWC24_17355 [Mycolicibacter senuensis]GFG68940.1 hypothetical protein MSEN_06600 [Mycolicibacter senuensis]
MADALTGLGEVIASVIEIVESALYPQRLLQVGDEQVGHLDVLGAVESLRSLHIGDGQACHWRSGGETDEESVVQPVRACPVDLELTILIRPHELGAGTNRSQRSGVDGAEYVIQPSVVLRVGLCRCRRHLCVRERVRAVRGEHQRGGMCIEGTRDCGHRVIPLLRCQRRGINTGDQL